MSPLQASIAPIAFFSAHLGIGCAGNRISPARELTEGCRPMGTREANAIGFIDDCFGGTVEEFEGALIDEARQLS